MIAYMITICNDFLDFPLEGTDRSLGSDLRIDKLEVLLGKQLRNKMTGPKGPWGKRGNQESCIVSPEFTYLWICAGGCTAVDGPKDKPDGVFLH